MKFEDSSKLCGAIFGKGPGDCRGCLHSLSQRLMVSSIDRVSFQIYPYAKRGIAVEKTWKPTAAGIICIIAGSICIIPIVIFASVTGLWGAALLISVPLVIAGIVPIVGGICALTRRIWGLALAGSILALIGTAISFVVSLALGVFISLGLSGTPGSTAPTIPDIFFYGFIVGFTVFAILGILAIIFISIGKREFR
jgi:hypothetical protein